MVSWDYGSNKMQKINKRFTNDFQHFELDFKSIYYLQLTDINNLIPNITLKRLSVCSKKRKTKITMHRQSSSIKV